MDTIDIQTNAGIQVLVLPKSVHIDDDKVYVKQVGNVLHLIPFHNPWQCMKNSLAMFSDDFMNERSQQNNQERDF